MAHFQRKIFQYTWLMCGQREDAEEVAQETLLKVFTRLGQLGDPNLVRPWVFRIARNECLMMRRKSVFAPAAELSLDEFLPVFEGEGSAARMQIADWSSLPEDGLLRSELHEQIEKAIRSLPESFRSVILLRDVEGLSTQETAQVLETNTALVKARLHRARLALRKQLDGYLRTAPKGAAAR